MLEALARNWRWVAIRAVMTLLFGPILLLNPGIRPESFFPLFGGFAVAEDFFTVLSAARRRRPEER
jgi:uncharacterized membrane protein HdeD (DUF308 family)